MFTRKVLITCSGVSSVAFALALTVIYVPGVEQESVVGVNLYVFVVSVVLCLCQGFYDGSVREFVLACDYV